LKKGLWKEGDALPTCRGGSLMKDGFNVYYHFAGTFIPSWLLSRSEISAGAKLTYAMLAQQANSSGATQLNFRMLEGALGESEGQIARYLLDLERVGLVHAKRGNINIEDVRIFFPQHAWFTGAVELPNSLPGSSSNNVVKETQPQLFNVAAVSTLTTSERQAAAEAKSVSPFRQRKKKRWFGRPRSRHSLETCVGFITYQKEVLGRRSIYDPPGLAESIFHTGKQDDEIDDWLTEQANAA
jgi:hypothetical protein